MSLTLRRNSSAPARLVIPSFVALAGMLASLVVATPATALARADIPAEPAAWAATPYSPLTWPEVSAPGNALNLTFDAEAGGLPDAANVGTGFTMVQPSSLAGSNPYLLPENLSVSDGKLVATANPGIAFVTNNTQDNTLGTGVNASGKALYLTTTFVSPAAANGSAQAGLWFGPDDNNFVKLSLIGSSATGGRQVQLSKETNGAVTTLSGTSTSNADQIIVNTTQTILGTQPITLGLIVDDVAKRATATYQIGSGAPITVGTLTGLSASFFDGSLVRGTKPADSTITSFAGLFSTRRNMTPATTPLVYSFENFAVVEADVTAPAGPTGLTATAATGSIDLAWTASADADVAGYGVFRSTTAPVATTGVPVSGATPIKGTTFNDATTFGGTPYHYAVVAMDASGNVSGPATAGPATSAPTPGEAVKKVDFTTPAGTAVGGYTKDSGDAYTADRGFGWTNPAGAPTDYSAGTRIRTNPVDPRLQSVIHLQIENPTPIAPFAQWKLDVPNGTYTVVAAVGDTNVSSSGYDSFHSINAEGVKVIDRFLPNASREYDEVTLTGVEVSDGVLNIDATGGKNTKLAYLEVYRTAVVAPEVPAGVTAAASGSDIGLTWTASKDAVSYKVFRSSTATVDTSGAPLATVDTPAFTDETSEKGNTYYYSVIATSEDDVDSAASAPVQVVLAVVTPSVPAALAATLTGTDVTVTWTAENAVSYDVYRDTDADVDTSREPLDTVTVPTFTDTTTEAATTYYYAVKATSVDDVTSAASAALEVKVPEIEDPNPPVVCATSWKAEFFAGTSLAGAPVAVQCVSSIDQNYNGGLVPSGLSSANQYSVRWTRTIDEGAGSYEIATRTDDGVRVRIDGQLVVNRWTAQAADTTYTQQVPLTEGPHTVVVEYYQGFGDASAKVTVRKVITSCDTDQWLAEYFDGTSLSGAVVNRRCVDEIDQQFASGEAPAELDSNLYSIRWTRTIDEGAGSYAFSAKTDDGVRVKVDGKSLINEWYDQDATETHTAEVTLAAGPHLVVVEYYQGYNTASAEVGYVKTSADVEAPDVPTQLTTSSTSSTITLGWAASTATDTVGYRVYRSESEPVATTGTPLNGSTLLVAPGFIDTTAVPGVNYRYVVTAVDASGNASAASSPAPGVILVTPDTEAPTAPSALTATAAGSTVDLSWTASASTDLRGYRVYRSTEPKVAITGTPVSGTTPVTGGSFADTTVTNGTTYFYVIVAVDLAGNVSTASNEVVAVPQVPNTTNVKVDFTATNAAPVAGYLADWGQAYGVRTGATQGAGALSYGWMNDDGLQTSLEGNGRVRTRAGVPSLVNSMIHMQYGDVSGGTGTNGVKIDGTWELAVPDGLYSVKLAVGDEPGTTGYDSTHVINVEGTVGVERFTGTAAAEFSTITTTVGVWDGKLTVDAEGGFNTKLGYIEVVGLSQAPHVDTVLPANRVTGHDVNAGVSATIKVPYAGIGLNPSTLPNNARLYEVSTGALVPSTVGSSGGNDVISLAPNTPLKPLTEYRFVVTSGVKDNFGASFVPFTSLFTTGTGETSTGGEYKPITNVGFEKVELPTGRGKYWASFVFGPDGMLYGTTIGQGIWRFEVNDDGTLGEPENLGYEGVAHIGLLFDKSSTASNLKVWVTRTTANFSELGQWVSSVHQLSGPKLEVDRTIFEGLPRSLSDHLTNSMAYGPDGRIYVLQGSNQASGDLDNAWGQRGEQLLTGATLVFDPAHPQIATAANGGADINVQTAGTQEAGETAYDPYAANAPLKLYATGIRNAYDLVWHSNNHLYVATNGTAGGANTPGVTANANGTFTRTAAPGIPGFATVNGKDVTQQCVRRGYTGGTVPPSGNIPTQKDLLFDVEAGGYYGHPNPERCEWVLNAGNNPATPNAPGTAQSRYPVGTLADPNYRGVAYDFEFNKSPNGAIEYTSSTFGGQLKGRLIITRFSNNNDLQFLQPDPATGDILGAQTSVGITGVANSTITGVDGFNDPLEVVEDPSNGNLYVNQYDRSGGDQRMYLLRVPASQQASAVTTSVNELVFSGVKGTTSAPKTMTVTNNGNTAATVSTALIGGQTGEFTVTGGNVSIPAKGSATVSVRFQPASTAIGQRATTLRITAGTSTVNVGLYGLSMNGIEGQNEPTLANVLGTLGYGLNAGWTNLEGGVQPTAKGDEVLEPLFVKSGTAAPTMTPLAQYAPRENLPYGWYTGTGATADRRTLGSIDISGYQSLLPPTTAGTSPSFDPGAATFGFFYVSNVFQRVGYTEDNLNTGIAHRARVYPAKNRTGTVIPNSYIVAFEDASNGDYQDYLFVVTGVKPVTDTGSVDGGIRVDFTSKAGGLAPNYLRDYGQAFGPRTGADQGSGLSFGWKAEATEDDIDLSVGGTPAPGLGNGRDRASAQPDQRLDSFMHMRPETIASTFNGTRVNSYWEIALPNGQYTVTVGVGDPTVQSEAEIHSINVEAAPLMELFTPTGAAGSATRHKVSTGVFTVTDGFLTIDAKGGSNTKISYVDILPVAGGNDGNGDDPTDGAQVKVNFKTADAPTTTGWTPDTGAPFSTTAKFGWNTTAGAPVDRAAAMRYRPAASTGIAYPTDQLLKSGAHLQLPTAAVWEYVLPNGTYEVAVSVGDSAFLDSTHTVTAEGQPVVAAFAPTGTTPFQTGKRTVVVTDGRMTLAGAGENTKINWVSIKGDGLNGPVVPEPVLPTTKINFQPATVPAPTGWTADTGAAYSAATGYGWLVAGTPTDRSVATRYRATATAGIAFPAGDVTRQTFILTQSGGATAVSDGVWEYAIANGTYTVSVSVGDSGFLDSVHGVSVEGTSVVSNFTPTGGTPFTSGTAKVTVTDGKLTLNPTGSNTKVNWITIAGESLGAPSVAVTANGAAVGATYAGGPVTIAATAAAASGATIASLTYQLGAGPVTAYTAPIVVNATGEQKLTITATDSADRVTTRVLDLTIEDIGGTVSLRNEQATRVNGAPVPGFSEDWLVMQRINSGVVLHKTIDEATVTVTNTGTKNLKISRLALAGPNAAQFEIVNAPAGAVTVAPGASTPVTVKFIAASGTRGVRSAQLTIASSDPANPVTTVQLRGGYMTAPEGNSELDLAQISALYGWTTNVGNTENGDEMRTSPLNGEEVRSLLWKRADASLPVTARQLAAFHGCCDATERITINGASATHSTPYGQSILPLTATNGPTQLSTNPTGNFGIQVAGQTTNNAGYMAIKTWPLRDRAGKVIPGSWLVGHDYISTPNQCGIAPTNCDFQDNVYLVTNVLPVSSTDVTAPAAPTAPTADVTGSSVTVNWGASAGTDIAGYSVERATSAAGPWTRVSGTGLITGTTFVDAAIPAFVDSVRYRVVAADASGNASAPSTEVTVDVSALPNRAILIKAGGPAVTTGGRTWMADTYFTGGLAYRNPAVTQIAGTTDDALYTSERSDATTFGYDIPVPSGQYSVKLHFAEIYFGATGGGAAGTGRRVFDVNFEAGAKEIVGLDLNAKVAPMTAYVTTNSVTVTDGNLDLDFNATVNFPSIAAIEIVRTGDAPVAPAAASGLTGVVSGSGVALNWAASPTAGVSGYVVERAPAATGPWVTVSPAAPVAGTTFLNTNVPFAQTHYYRVTATSSASGLSSVATEPVAVDVSSIFRPTNLTNTVSSTSVALSWTAPAGVGIAGYRVERATAEAGPWTNVSGAAALTATSFTDASVPFGTAAVFYRVLALTSSGAASSPSSTTAANTSGMVQVIRVNAGGPAVTTGGNLWSADRGFTGGKTYSNPAVLAIAGTTDDALYLTERSAAGPFGYDFPLANGSYTVRLHFAEIYYGAMGGAAGGTGRRVFDVNLEGGATEVVGLDLNARVAPMTAFVTNNVVTVADGNLDIDFLAGVDQPKVSAIEILRGDAPQPVAPAAPGNPQAAVSGTSVALSWTASPDVTGYVVERAASATGPWTRISGTTPIPATSFTDAGRTAGSTVYYRVAAVGLTGLASAPSATVTAVIPAPAVAPAAPTAVTAALAGTSVTVGWTASATTGVVGYHVERAASATGPWTRLTGTTPAVGSSFTDAAVPAGATAYYRVIAVGPTGLASTPSATANVAVPFPAPAAPTALTATVAGTSVALSWTASTSTGVTGYFVERAASATGPWTRVSGAPAVTGTSYSDATVAAGSTVFYRVTASGQGGVVSTPSNTVTATRPATPTQQPVRINAGGGALTAGGVAWAADTSFVGGKAYSNPAVTQIGGTTSDAIYTTERSAAGPFAYDIPVANGQYTVKLHFAEIYHGAPGGGAGGTGRRVFSVNLEGGTTEVVGLDLNSKVAPATAWITTNVVTVTGGILDIDFIAGVDQPKISAIEVLPGTQPAPAAPATPTGVAATVSGTSNTVTWAANGSAGYVVERGTAATGPWTRLNAVPTATATFADASAPQSGTVHYRVSAISSEGISSAASAPVSVTRGGAALPTVRINAGGPAVNAGGFTWQADASFTGGKVYSNPAVTQIAGTTSDALYLNERSGTTSPGSYAYDVPVPNGNYTVRLHFAEIYFGATGGGAAGTGRRVFNVNFEGGANEIVGLDLNARVAPMTAFITTNAVTVTGGNLDIDFASTVNQPTVAAIEIVPVDGAAVVAPAGAPATATPLAGPALLAAPPSTGTSGQASATAVPAPSFRSGAATFGGAIRSFPAPAPAPATATFQSSASTFAPVESASVLSPNAVEGSGSTAAGSASSSLASAPSAAVSTNQFRKAVLAMLALLLLAGAVFAHRAAIVSFASRIPMRSPRPSTI